MINLTEQIQQIIKDRSNELYNEEMSTGKDVFDKMKELNRLLKIGKVAGLSSTSNLMESMQLTLDILKHRVNVLEIPDDANFDLHKKVKLNGSTTKTN